MTALRSSSACQEFELRVICWSAKDIPKEALDGSGLGDLYSTMRFGRGKALSTDTHLRAKDGKASWNWRFKIPLTMDQCVSFSKSVIATRIRRGVAAPDCRRSRPLLIPLNSADGRYVSPEELRLAVQLWDADLLTSNDCIGEEVLLLMGS